LSNEQHQLNQIFKLIGTPTVNELDALENTHFKEFLKKLKKCEPQPFEPRWPHADSHALTLLKRMLQFDPMNRISVEEALDSPFFKAVRKREKEKVSSISMSFPWEDLPRLSRDAEKDRLRKLILHEITLIQMGVNQQEVENDDATTKPVEEKKAAVDGERK
jgi:serine/threonine protein kinase